MEGLLRKVNVPDLLAASSSVGPAVSCSLGIDGVWTEHGQPLALQAYYIGLICVRTLLTPTAP